MLRKIPRTAQGGSVDTHPVTHYLLAWCWEGLSVPDSCDKSASCAGLSWAMSSGHTVQGSALPALPAVQQTGGGQ